MLGARTNCDIDSIWVDQQSFTCDQLGAQVVKLGVMDGAGNIDEATASILVLDSIAPVFTSCIDHITVDSGSIVEYDLPTAIDNCSVDSLVMGRD